jgi:hypothetical protein
VQATWTDQAVDVAYFERAGVFKQIVEDSLDRSAAPFKPLSSSSGSNGRGEALARVTGAVGDGSIL